MRRGAEKTCLKKELYDDGEVSRPRLASNVLCPLALDTGAACPPFGVLGVYCVCKDMVVFSKHVRVVSRMFVF